MEKTDVVAIEMNPYYVASCKSKECLVNMKVYVWAKDYGPAAVRAEYYGNLSGQLVRNGNSSVSIAELDGKDGFVLLIQHTNIPDDEDYDEFVKKCLPGICKNLYGVDILGSYDIRESR